MASNRSSRPGRSSFSLRTRLQASSLMAVLAGYALLLIGFQQLAVRGRLERHDRMIGELASTLLSIPVDITIEGLQSRVDGIVAPGRMLWLESEPGQPLRPAAKQGSGMDPSVFSRQIQAAATKGGAAGTLQSFQVQGKHYVQGSLPIAYAGGQVQLMVVDDVSEEVSQVHRLQLLVLAVALLSSLITSGLLRLVLQRGLRPLDQLSSQLEVIDGERLGRERLATEGQPLELQPIVMAFNRLLERLSAGREREREFVDGVAHELRTPITLISGFTQRLQRQGNSDATVEQIASETRRMTRLVADLLDIARDDAGRLEMRAAAFDLDDVLLQVFERMEPLGGGRLVLHPPGEGEPPLAWGDADRLQQCLTNLVENAIKYTPADAAIELYSSRNGSMVTAHVRDHGPGVPQADKTRIFARFARGTVPTIGKDGGAGSGIGLSVVKLLVRHMQGAVRVEDAPGGGADFQLSLPSQTRGDPTSPPVDPHAQLAKGIPLAPRS